MWPGIFASLSVLATLPLLVFLPLVETALQSHLEREASWQSDPQFPRKMRTAAADAAKMGGTCVETAEPQFFPLLGGTKRD